MFVNYFTVLHNTVRAICDCRIYVMPFFMTSKKQNIVIERNISSLIRRYTYIFYFSENEKGYNYK